MKYVEVENIEEQPKPKDKRTILFWHVKNITVSQERKKRPMIITRKLLSCDSVNLYNLTWVRILQDETMM